MQVETEKFRLQRDEDVEEVKSGNQIDPEDLIIEQKKRRKKKKTTESVRREERRENALAPSKRWDFYLSEKGKQGMH